MTTNKSTFPHTVMCDYSSILTCYAKLEDYSVEAFTQVLLTPLPVCLLRLPLRLDKHPAIPTDTVLAQPQQVLRVRRSITRQPRHNILHTSTTPRTLLEQILLPPALTIRPRTLNTITPAAIPATRRRPHRMRPRARAPNNHLLTHIHHMRIVPVPCAL